jgi:hypothetical protein
MEVSGQLHTPAALPTRETAPAMPIVYYDKGVSSAFKWILFLVPAFFVHTYGTYCWKGTGKLTVCMLEERFVWSNLPHTEQISWGFTSKHQIFCVTPKLLAGFEVITAVNVKSTVFWDLTLCRPVFYRRFGRMRCLYLKGRAGCFLLVSCLDYSPAHKMEAVRSSETLMNYRLHKVTSQKMAVLLVYCLFTMVRVVSELPTSVPTHCDNEVSMSNITTEPFYNIILQKWYIC